MKTVTLAAGDELVIGPATGTAEVKYEIESVAVSVEVRDAIEHRDQMIVHLRERIAELEGERGASADEIADAVIERLREALL